MPEAEGAATIKLFVKTLTGKLFEIQVDPDASPSVIKDKVEEKEGIPAAQQRIVFSGKQLQDEFEGKTMTLKSYNVTAEATVHLVMLLRGGRA